MQADNFAHALRAYSTATPFRRCTVELVNGVRLIGQHPECFRIEDGGLVVYVEPNGDIQAFDASAVARFVSAVLSPDDD